MKHLASITFAIAATILLIPPHTFAAENLTGTGSSQHSGDIAFSGQTTEGSPTPYGVAISNDGQLSGYAWSQITGWISLSGSALDASTYGVEIYKHMTADQQYLLQGYAWSEIAGWISFSGPTYQVRLNDQNHTSNGEMAGYAWSELTGYIDMSQVNTIGHMTSFTNIPSETSFEDLINFMATANNPEARKFSDYAYEASQHTGGMIDTNNEPLTRRTLKNLREAVKSANNQEELNKIASTLNEILDPSVKLSTTQVIRSAVFKLIREAQSRL